MKKITLTLLIAAAMIGFSMTSNAQEDASTSVATSANVITPITITGKAPLGFGDIVGTAAGGNVTVTSGGDRSADATGLLIAGTPGTVSAASFEVAGQPGYTFAITLPPSFTVANGTTTGAPTMTVSGFETTPATQGTLDGTSGKLLVAVGAKLAVGTSQAPGAYTNDTGLKITVQYN